MTVTEQLYTALVQAAMSLETIDEQAGKEPELKTIRQVRGYAHNRANVAREAIRAYEAGISTTQTE